MANIFRENTPSTPDMASMMAGMVNTKKAPVKKDVAKSWSSQNKTKKKTKTKLKAKSKKK